jgi:hypothetical protein
MIEELVILVAKHVNQSVADADNVQLECAHDWQG